jgi:hypothetical protein
VDEHAQAGFKPPSHTGVALLGGFGVQEGGGHGEEHQQMVRSFLNGRLENTAFCLLS